MDQNSKATAAAAQVIAAVKAKLTMTSNIEFDTISGEISTPKELAQQSQWQFTITQERGVYGVMSGWEMLGKYCSITPSFHAALFTAAAAELLAFKCDDHRLSYGFIHVSIKMP